MEKFLASMSSPIDMSLVDTQNRQMEILKSVGITNYLRVLTDYIYGNEIADSFIKHYWQIECDEEQMIMLTLLGAKVVPIII